VKVEPKEVSTNLGREGAAKLNMVANRRNRGLYG
jgi:hypothetical protein